MATTPKLPAVQPRVDRNRTGDAQKTGRTKGDGTGVDIRASLPPIYREDGQQKGGGQGQGRGGNTQLARAIQGSRSGLFPAVSGGPREKKALFNPTSPASYFDPACPGGKFVPKSYTEECRPLWMKKFSSLGGGRMITFNTPAFTAANPGVVKNPSYDIPGDWTDQLKHGLTEARVNDVTDGRPMPHRTAVYNLVGGIIRA